jgi:4-alpha-glucanotransferase
MGGEFQDSRAILRRIGPVAAGGKMADTMKKRKSGLLLHITSLPSEYGTGDLGPEAYKFADFLARAKQSFWQILPLNPPADMQDKYSPYDSYSAFAGNTTLISPELLYRQGLLSKADLRDCPKFPETKVEYPKVISYKAKLLNIAWENFAKRPRRRDYEKFCLENKIWLDDYSLFMALREHFHGKLWRDWPVELRERWTRPLAAIKTRLGDSINRQKCLQYLFFSQWSDLKQYCARLGIEIIGDVPIYVSYDSADVWANPEIFQLNRYRNPEFVSGVPPDLFSKTGQLWGNPVFNWLVLKKTNYSWWLERIRHNLAMFDRVRIDHFRGFFRYWRVLAGDKTAKNGKWMKGPGWHFLDLVFRHFPKKSIIVEDLGYITPDIKEYVASRGLAGMRVLQFGFGGNPKTNSHYPANHIENSICYTGTHDNNTIVGWRNEIDAKQKARLIECLGHRPALKDFNWEMIQLAFESVANLAIIPVQDILGLGTEGRMNHPAKTKGNWQ